MPSTIGVAEAATRSLATLTRPPALEVRCMVVLGIGGRNEACSRVVNAALPASSWTGTTGGAECPRSRSTVLRLIAQAGGGVVEAYPRDTGGRKISASFLYNGTRSLSSRPARVPTPQGQEPFRDAQGAPLGRTRKAPG